MKYICSLLLLSVTLTAQPATRYFDLLTQVEQTSDGRSVYHYQPTKGTECRNNALNRNALLSEDQINYPAPESGCGPTAMLNILIWYEKYGLIPPGNRNADPRSYKLKLFNSIDAKLLAASANDRANSGGTRSSDTALVMDQILRERTGGKLRMHTSELQTPLDLQSLHDLMPNFRAGYLIVTPKSRATGKLLSVHAATFIRIDRANNLTLGTWGELYRGRIQQRGSEQWFIPQNSEQLELRIEGLVSFIPFRPLP